MENPVVFFDISLGRQLLGRVKFELFANEVPKTCENFRQFCTGEYRENLTPIGYKNSIFHRVIKGFMIHGGDFVKGDGRGSKSIYGKDEFEDENFIHKREYLIMCYTYIYILTKRKDEPMTLSMANSGPNTNGCQFFICCDELPHLDGKHVVFGRVIEGQDIIKKIEYISTDDNDKPLIDVTVVECGEY